MEEGDDYGTGGLMDDPEDYYPSTPPPTTQIFTMGSGKEIVLHLVGHSPTEAHHLWNGAKIISDYFEEDPARVRGKTVLELGAASGLPSLVAGILGAKKVVMTDFPDPDLVMNMQKNIDECDETTEPKGHIAKTIDAAGFVWGGDPVPLIARLSSDKDGSSAATTEERFDVLILADLLFRHSEHGALVKTIRETMKVSRESAAYVFFTSYRPWKKDLDMGFFDVAREAGFEVEQVLEKKLEKPLFENDPGDLDVQKTVKGFVVRWPETTMPAQPASSHLTQLQTNGFVIIKSILPASQLALLRTLSLEATGLARSGKWPHVRTVGKQFPPWNASEASSHGIWGVQHLMNPRLPGYAAFTALYFSEEVLGIVKELLGCEDEDLVMELFNMLVRPEADFELRWHRDDIPAEATPEEEMERLGRPAFHAQYNLALWEDESLVVVPGSHLRARTEVERAAGPFERELPGQLVVRLEPGDIVFYNNNILHRGVYDSSKERATLHGSVGHVGGSRLRARNVLQHGVGGWVDEVDLGGLGDKERRRAEGMRERLVRMGGESGEVGYSLEG
ncbi:Protein N-methyltransferase NNT1 [Trichoderma ghanense]|uniref:Protein N-terminal and lysine N-methyltransferase EFM7 n=1 Tax=Trichoderma ghanense TaxID=65468 RepID=A0ABY2HFZ6_9HYPO